jgi:hypothetical protein
VRTSTDERYFREWLANQAAGGYAQYHAASGEYALSEEQALCLANPDGPIDLAGAYSIVEDLFHIKQRALDNVRSGKGMEWGEHHSCLFHGPERFFRAGYIAHLLEAWLPSLQGVIQRLTHGTRAGRRSEPQAGERRLRKVVVDDGGFTRFRRAAETPFNIVLEARP